MGVTGGALGLSALALAFGVCCVAPCAVTVLGVAGAVLLARLAIFHPCVLGQLSDGDSTAAAAAEYGFFDQAHLNRDAKRLTRETPGQLAQNRASEFSKTHCDAEG